MVSFMIVSFISALGREVLTTDLRPCKSYPVSSLFAYLGEGHHGIIPLCGCDDPGKSLTREGVPPSPPPLEIFICEEVPSSPSSWGFLFATTGLPHPFAHGNPRDASRNLTPAQTSPPPY